MFTAFALAKAPGFARATSLLALLGFLVGAAAGGILTAVPHLTTTVFTMTLTGIAADIRDPSSRPALFRRPLAVTTTLGKVLSAVPWIWITEMGFGEGQSPSMFAESGPIAAKTSVSHASSYASIPPLEIPVA